MRTTILLTLMAVLCTSCARSALSRVESPHPPESDSTRSALSPGESPPPAESNSTRSVLSPGESPSPTASDSKVLPIRMGTGKPPLWCKNDDTFWSREKIGDRGRYAVIMLTRMMVAALSGDERYLGLPELATVRRAIAAGQGAYIVVPGSSLDSAPGIRVTGNPYDVARDAYDNQRDVLVFELTPERYFFGPEQGNATRVKYSWRVVAGEIPDPTILKFGGFSGSTTLCLIEEEEGWAIYRVGVLIQS